MPNLKDIKNRIGSVESTKKITRAMKMVAAAKVKRAETTVKISRPFTDELNNMFAQLLGNVDITDTDGLKINSAVDNYPALLKEREGGIKSVGLIAITSNKGLAGAYNANVIRRTVQKIAEYNAQGKKVVLFILGQKGIAPLKRRIEKLDCEIAGTYLSIMNNPTGSASNLITEEIAQYFVEGKIDKIEVVTTRFKNMMSYLVEEWKVLPLDDSSEVTKIMDQGAALAMMEFYPSIQSVLQQVVPLYITNIIYQSILEAQASELASRMTAMSAATTNAEKMIGDLSILYNKSRQNAITQELIEVISGANSQNGG